MMVFLLFFVWMCAKSTLEERRLFVGQDLLTDGFCGGIELRDFPARCCRRVVMSRHSSFQLLFVELLELYQHREVGQESCRPGAEIRKTGGYMTFY